MKQVHANLLAKKFFFDFMKYNFTKRMHVSQADVWTNGHNHKN